MKMPVHDADCTDIARSNARPAQSIKRIGRQQRAIAVGDLVGTRIEDVERVGAQIPTIVETIADARIHDPRRRALEGAVFCQRLGAEIPVFQRAIPSRLFTEFDSCRRHDAFSFRNEVAGGVANKCSIRKRSGIQQIEIRQRLQHIDTAESGMNERDVAVEAHP